MTVEVNLLDLAISGLVNCGGKGIDEPQVNCDPFLLSSGINTESLPGNPRDD